MMETVLAFLAGIATGYLITWPALVALFVLGIFLEHNSHRGWAVFIGIVALVTSYFYFAVPLLTLAYYAAGYLAAGLTWSFWRYGRFVRSEVARIKSYGYSTEIRKNKAEDLSPGNHIDTLVAWVVIWPISAVENLTGDVLSAIQYMVTNTFKSVYNKIYSSNVASLLEEKPKASATTEK